MNIYIASLMISHIETNFLHTSTQVYVANQTVQNKKHFSLLVSARAYFFVTKHLTRSSVIVSIKFGGWKWCHSMISQYISIDNKCVSCAVFLLFLWLIYLFYLFNEIYIQLYNIADVTKSGQRETVYDGRNRASEC